MCYVNFWRIFQVSVPIYHEPIPMEQLLSSNNKSIKTMMNAETAIIMMRKTIVMVIPTFILESHVFIPMRQDIHGWNVTPIQFSWFLLIFLKNIWIIHEKYSMINKHLGYADVVEWQTRYFEGVVSVCSCEFKSHRLHQFDK